MSVIRSARRRAAAAASSFRRQLQYRRPGGDRAAGAIERLEDRTLFAAAVALSGSNLLRFDTAAPTAIASTTAITGINGGETLVGIDYRPQNGFLYGLGVDATANTATLYAISTRTGVAGVVGSAPGAVAFTTDGTTPVDLPDPATVGYGFDFNPAADRIRVTAGSLNFRLNPNTGAGVDGDNTGNSAGTVTGTNPDGAISGGTTKVSGAAYTNNQPNNANVTTLYTLDSGTDSLFIQNPANSGTQTLGQAVTLGGSPLPINSVDGFDIPAGVNVISSGGPVTTGAAFAVFNVGGVTGLYSLNLVDAEATYVGNVGTGATAVQGLAVQSDLGGAPAIGLVDLGPTLTRFNTSTPTTANAQAINASQLALGETLVGIDFRPQTGQLYGLAVDAAANTATLYIIDPQTGALTAVGAQGSIALVGADGTTPVDLPDPATAGYGFDFNPTVDRVRVTASTGLNFRVNPNSGAAVDGDGSAPGVNPDTAISGNGVTGVAAAAYTNSFGQPLVGTATTLYTLDAATDSLYIQNPANGGAQTTPLPVTFGGNPLDFTDVNGFDILARVAVGSNNAPAAGVGYAALTVGGNTALYLIDLATGAATSPGNLATGGFPFAGLALGDVPDPVVILPSLSIGDAAVAEGNAGTTTAATVNVTLSEPSASTVTVNYATVDGQATGADDDYEPTTGTLTFVPGETSKTIDVTINGDATTEPNEAFPVNLSAASNATIADGIGAITINNDDAVPTISVGADPSVVEGTGVGSTVLTFDVALSNPSSEVTSVQVATSDGSATLADNDYVPQNITVTFLPGATQATIQVPVTRDAKVEPNEAVNFAITNVLTPGAVTLGAKTSAVGTIIDDDVSTLTVTDVTQAEGNAGQTAFKFTLARAGGDLNAISTVDYETAPGTAIAGTDYQSAAGTVTFQAGQTSRTVTVFVNGDSDVEADETFFLNLSDPSNLLMPDAQATGTILNDDAPPSSVFSVNDVSRTEGNSGTKDFTFTVTRTGDLSAAASVVYNTTALTASHVTDYNGKSNTTLNFAPGQATRTVSIQVKGDTKYEQDEAFLFKLSSPSAGSALGDSSGNGVIINDDLPPVLSVADVSVTEGNSGTKTLTFTVKLSKASERAATVSYATANGSASSASDYSAKSGSLVFGPGTTSKTVSITVKGDKAKEGNETFYLNLFGADAATIGDKQGKGTIKNDD